MIESESILQVLDGKRMMSLGNLAEMLDCAWEELIDAMRELEQRALVRVVTSQCGGASCSSCAGCSSEYPSEPEWSDRSIVISMKPSLENA